MVDGKEFFSNDPKVASKNFPAKMIDKVQVLDKKSDMAQMTGFRRRRRRNHPESHRQTRHEAWLVRQCLRRLRQQGPLRSQRHGEPLHRQRPVHHHRRTEQYQQHGLLRHGFFHVLRYAWRETRLGGQRHHNLRERGRQLQQRVRLQADYRGEMPVIPTPITTRKAPAAPRLSSPATALPSPILTYVTTR